MTINKSPLRFFVTRTKTTSGKTLVIADTSYTRRYLRLCECQIKRLKANGHIVEF